MSEPVILPRADVPPVAMHCGHAVEHGEYVCGVCTMELLAERVAAEREACAKAICSLCRSGVGFADPAECDRMRHGDGKACHPYGSGHRLCDAAAIRART